MTVFLYHSPKNTRTARVPIYQHRKRTAFLLTIIKHQDIYKYPMGPAQVPPPSVRVAQVRTPCLGIQVALAGRLVVGMTR